VEQNYTVLVKRVDELTAELARKNASGNETSQRGAEMLSKLWGHGWVRFIKKVLVKSPNQMKPSSEPANNETESEIRPAGFV